MELFSFLWRFDNCYTVDCVGKGGDLVLLCMGDANLETFSYSHNHIEAKVGVEDKAWPMTSIYGLPWLCVGDFNEMI